MTFDGVKVFSSRIGNYRQQPPLDEQVTAWLRDSGAEVTAYDVRQSSDTRYHCLSIVLRYRANGASAAPRRTRSRADAAA